MADIPWQPLAYIFVQGLLVGLVVGFAVRKLNKAIAAVLGFSVLAINVVWFARMMGVELPVPQVNDLVDSLLRLLPFTLSDVTERFGSLMPVMTSLPFIGGLLVGAWAGFKLA
jgi:uncharacterized membrane protein (Fun14 family)